MKSYLALLIVFILAGCATAPAPTAMPLQHGAVSAGLAAPMHAAGMFTWPVNGIVSVPFGSKVDRVLSKGMDIKADAGTAVRAAKAGRVVYCDSGLKGFGKTVILDHGSGYQTVYAYLSEILTTVGSRVEQGDVIANVGRSGRARQTGLHFEVRRNGNPENPIYYLSRR